MSRYFKLKEFIESETAKANGIENIPDFDQVENLVKLAFILDAVREVCKFPIHINSGFRSSELNDKVGGSKTSAHLHGCASDIRPAGKFATDANLEKLGKVLAAAMDNFDQVIWYPSKKFYHVGICEENVKSRHQWLVK